MDRSCFVLLHIRATLPAAARKTGEAGDEAAAEATSHRSRLMGEWMTQNFSLIFLPTRENCCSLNCRRQLSIGLALSQRHSHILRGPMPRLPGDASAGSMAAAPQRRGWLSSTAWPSQEMVKHAGGEMHGLVEDVLAQGQTLCLRLRQWSDSHCLWPDFTLGYLCDF